MPIQFRSHVISTNADTRDIIGTDYRSVHIKLHTSPDNMSVWKLVEPLYVYIWAHVHFFLLFHPTQTRNPVKV